MSKLEKKLQNIKLEEGIEYLNVDFDFGEDNVLDVISRVEEIIGYCMNNKNKKREEYEKRYLMEL